MNLQRIALGVQYDGSNYHGWQYQQGLATVQGCLDKALSRVANHPVVLTCAGRTDAGVHASGQVVHFNTEVYRSDYSWVYGANSYLPRDINVVWAKQVSLDFHARFSAQARRYHYLIFNHNVRSSILHNAVAWYYRQLDETAMHAGGQYLLGEHDFSAYRGAGCQATSPVRNIHELSVKRYQHMIMIEVVANAFLLHMVRNIVGVLIMIGCGDRPIEWAQEVLQSHDRCHAAATAAPRGLYLVHVSYPQIFALPENPIVPSIFFE